MFFAWIQLAYFMIFFLLEPSRHILFTLAGLAIGYRFHLFEENSEDRYKELIKKHKNAPWYDRGVLLAEKASKGDEDETGMIEGTTIFCKYFAIVLLLQNWMKKLLCHCLTLRGAAVNISYCYLPQFNSICFCCPGHQFTFDEVNDF